MDPEMTSDLKSLQKKALKKHQFLFCFVFFSVQQEYKRISHTSLNRCKISPGNVSLRCRAASRGGVFVQQGHTAEGPGAGATLVLLDLGVGLQMGAQVGAVSKSSVTVLTSKGTLTCMCANVSPEQPRSGEGFSTCGTHTGQGV